MYEKISSIIHNEPKFQQQSKDHVSLGKMGFDFGPMRGEKDRKRAQSLAHKPSKFLPPATRLSGQNLSVPSALND